MRAEDLGILSYELEWEYDLSRDLLYACTFQDKYSKTVDLQTAVSRLQKKIARKGGYDSKKDGSTTAKQKENTKKGTSSKFGDADTANDGCDSEFPPSDDDADHDSHDQLRQEIGTAVARMEDELAKLRKKHKADLEALDLSDSSGFMPLAREIATKPDFLTELAEKTNLAPDDIAGALAAVEAFGPEDEAHDLFDSWAAQDRTEIEADAMDATERDQASKLEAFRPRFGGFRCGRFLFFLGGKKFCWITHHLTT